MSKKIFFKRVSIRIRNLRKEKSLSTYRLFLLSGVTPSLIGKVELGRRDMHLSTLIRILKGLNTTPQEFFNGIDIPDDMDE